jgi:hypothetical protein
MASEFVSRVAHQPAAAAAAAGADSLPTAVYPAEAPAASGYNIAELQRQEQQYEQQQQQYEQQQQQQQQQQDGSVDTRARRLHVTVRAHPGR